MLIFLADLGPWLSKSNNSVIVREAKVTVSNEAGAEVDQFHVWMKSGGGNKQEPTMKMRVQLVVEGESGESEKVEEIARPSRVTREGRAIVWHAGSHNWHESRIRLGNFD